MDGPLQKFRVENEPLRMFCRSTAKLRNKQNVHGRFSSTVSELEGTWAPSRHGPKSSLFFYSLSRLELEHAEKFTNLPPGPSTTAEPAHVDILAGTKNAN